MSKVTLEIPQIMCHLELANEAGDTVMMHRILPTVPQPGQRVVITTKTDVYLGEVVKIIWQFSEDDLGSDSVQVKIKQIEIKR